MIRASSGRASDADPSATPVRRTGFGVVGLGSVVSTVTFGAVIGPAGPVSSPASVTVPAFTRVDAAFYYTFSERLRAQVNVENVLDTRYYSAAHSNNNITPGSPRAVRVSWTTSF